VISYLKAAVLCSKGWLDSKLIVVSVVVGFLYMYISRCGGFRFMLRSRKFVSIFFLCRVEFYVAVYLVSISFGCILLES
jgi:hypothetical protein